MAVFTCAEIVEGCRRGDDAAWGHFTARYLPLAGAVLDRHFPEHAARRDELLREALAQARDDNARFFRDYQGHSEREFLLHWREQALRVGEAAAPAPAPPQIPLEWETFQKAIADFTALERQMIWMTLLSPLAGDADKVLRVDPKTVASVLGRAQEALRGASDHWNPQMLVENRHRLIDAARAAATEDCPLPRQFLRLLDGQITWRDRQGIERHLTRCWRCVDVLCRFREVVYLPTRR